MRILASTTAGTGHFLPMVPVLGACRQARHEVLVACPASFASTVAAAGFDVAPFPDAPAAALHEVVRHLPGLPPDEANRLVVREVFGRLGTSAALPGLSSTLERWRPDLIVRDASEFASWLLARRAELPVARVGVGLLSLEPTWASVAAAALRDVAASTGVVCDATALAAGQVFTAAPAAFDPPHPAAAVTVHRYREKLPAAAPLPTLPEGDAPLVYVTFGTVAASLGTWPRLYRAVLDGLEALPVRVLVTTGGQAEPAELGPLPPTVRVVPFVPQASVLGHASVMVAHGGFGTVLGGLRAGVPMVLVPLFADQFSNAARVADLGAGVVLPTSFDPGCVPPELSEGVRTAVVRLLEDTAPRIACGALAREMDSQPVAGSLVPILEAIARERR